MSASRPSFRVMKNGYDRFAVEDAIEAYVSQINQLQHKLQLYQEQLIETTQQLDELKEQYQLLQNDQENQKQLKDQITRAAIREANDIISTANQNADMIIQEALRVAKGVLIDLTNLYRQAGSVKTDMTKQLEDILKQIDSFTLPKLPSLDWLKEAEKKMQ